VRGAPGGYSAGDAGCQSENEGSGKKHGGTWDVAALQPAAILFSKGKAL
jgi:hypothetical protein